MAFLRPSRSIRVVGYMSKYAVGRTLYCGTFSVRRLLKIWRPLLSGGLARQVLTLSSATALAQMLALVTTPLITRLYSPEAFGHLAVFCAIVALILPLISLRYEWALLLPSDEGHAIDVLSLCFALVALFSVPLTAAALIAAPILADWNVPLSRSEIYLLPAATIIVGLYTVMTNWLIRRKSFPVLARTRFSAITATLIWQIILGFSFEGSACLILAYILGYLFAVLYAMYHCRPMIRRLTRDLSLLRMRRVARQHRAFAIISAPSQVANVLGQALANATVPLLYGPYVGGQFMLAQRVITQPFILLGEAVAQVFRGNAPDLMQSDPQRLWALFWKLNCALLIVISPALSLSIFGPQLFTLVFGPAWHDAGSYAGIIIFAEVFAFVAGSTCVLLPLVPLNRHQGAWEIGRLAVVGAALMAAWLLSWSPLACLAALAAAGGASYVALFILNVLAIRRRARARAQETNIPRLVEGTALP
jgi:lipopolysaccharide exporter